MVFDEFHKQHYSHTISGEKLDSILNGMPLLKFMRDDDVHHGFQYKTGLNKDILPFKNNSYENNGIHFVRLCDCINWIDCFGDNARRVRVDPNELVFVDYKQLKSKSVILEERKPKKELIKEYVKNDQMMIWLMRTNGLFLQFIDPKDRTHEIIIEAVQQNGHALQFVDHEQRTHSIIIAALKSRGGGTALQYIEQINRTMEMIIQAVQNDATALKFVEPDQKTPELLKVAVNENGFAFQYICPKMRTFELMLQAVLSTPLAFESIKYACGFNDIQVNQMVIEMIRKDGMNIQYMRSIHLTDQMEAVKNNGLALAYVEPNRQTREIIFAALKQNGLALKHIRRSQRTNEMISIAIKQNREAIECIDPKDRTICMKIRMRSIFDSKN